MLLAIDTSSAYASVALHDREGVLAEETWHAHRRHDDHLFPAIERLLTLAGRTREEIARVAVSTGPGSFTGLRVGIAAAQGIVRASHGALLGVPTCDVIAHPFASAGRRVCVLIDAGRGEHYSCVYRTRRGAWGRTTEIRTSTLAEIARTVALETIFAGDVPAQVAAELRELLGRLAVVPPASARVRRAGHLAEIAWARAEAGERAEPSAVEPIYVRPPLIRGTAGRLLASEGTVPAAVGGR